MPAIAASNVPDPAGGGDHVPWYHQRVRARVGTVVHTAIRHAKGESGAIKKIWVAGHMSNSSTKVGDMWGFRLDKTSVVGKTGKLSADAIET